MDPAKLVGIRQWFISCVDDGPILLDPFKEVIHDVIRSLRNLEGQCVRAVMERGPMHDQRPPVHPSIQRTGGADPSRAGKDLSSHQVRDQLVEASSGKGKLPGDEIVFV